MKILSLIITIAVLLLSFQNCAQDPYTAADGNSKGSSSSQGLFDNDDQDITDDIGANDNINLPDNTTPPTGQQSPEYYQRLLEIQTMPTENTSDGLYSATPMEFLLMTDTELDQLNIKLQEIQDNKAVKDIEIMFDLRNIDKLIAYIKVKTNDSSKTTKVQLPASTSKAFINAFKDIKICEYIIKRDKPMCEQVVTEPHSRKMINSNAVLDIGYKEDKCPIKYIDICPSDENLHNSMLDFIGSNYEDWIQDHKL